MFHKLPDTNSESNQGVKHNCWSKLTYKEKVKILSIIVFLGMIILGIIWYVNFYIIPGYHPEPVVTTGCINDALTGCAKASSTTAYLTGTIDGQGTYHFEYGPTSIPNQFTTPTLPLTESSVGQLIWGLTPNTDYQFRLILDWYAGEWQNFQTLDWPDVILDDPSNITNTTANFSGFIDPMQSLTLQYWFEYGTAVYPYHYSTMREIVNSSGSVVSAVVQNLTSDVTYKVRLAALEKDDPLYTSIFYTFGKYFHT